jgi:hypothetical protein
VYRRIELIDHYRRKRGNLYIGTLDIKHGLLGLSPEEVVDAWIDKLRGSFRSLPINSRFYFTELGWKEVGRKVITACQQIGQEYKVIKVKENSVEVVWRDKHTGYEVAVQPRKEDIKLSKRKGSRDRHVEEDC